MHGHLNSIPSLAIQQANQTWSGQEIGVVYVWVGQEVGVAKYRMLECFELSCLGVVWGSKVVIVSFSKLQTLKNNIHIPIAHTSILFTCGA